MANITEDSHQNKLSLPENNNSNTMKNIDDDQESDEEDTLSLSDLPIGKNNDDSAADRNQIPSTEKTQDLFEFSSPNRIGGKVRKPTVSSTRSPENIRFLVNQGSPMLSKSSSKSSPGKRSVKKSENWIFQKSKSTSFYPSRSKKNTKGGTDQEYEEQKVSIFSSPLKSKWLFVLLGLPPKIPTDAVELKTDIKNRQSRHAPSTFFPANAGGGCEELVAEDCLKASEKRKKRTLVSCFSGGPVQI